MARCVYDPRGPNNQRFPQIALRMAYNPNPPRTTGDSYIHDTVANGPPNSGDADARPPTVDISPEAKERLMKQGKSMQHDAGPDDSKSFYKGKVEGKLMHALLVTGIVEPQMPTGQLVQEFPFFRPYKQSSMRKYMNSWGNNRKNVEANKRKCNMLQVVRAHHLPCPCHSGAKLDHQPGTEQDAKPQAKTHAKAPPKSAWDTPKLKTGDCSFNVGSFVPATMQTVAGDTKHHQHLLLVVEMPGHIQAKTQLSIDLLDSHSLSITRPRGLAMTDIDGLTTVLCGIRAIDEQDGKMYGHAMEEHILRSQMRKNNNKRDPIYDRAVITLDAEVDVGKGIFSFLIHNPHDQSASLFVILDLPVEIGYGKEDFHEEAIQMV